VYVAHYGIWSIEANLHCGDTARQLRTFCSPKRITPAVHALYQNLGDGTFSDVTERVGIARTDGRGQGVVASDIDMDGHVDLYVANDLTPNFLFLNRGDGSFRDVTDFSGVAMNRDGLAQAGMGVDCADIDRDGLPDLFVTNFRHEYNALYINLDHGTFMDKSHSAGVAGDSMDEVGWGTRLVDFDNDGWPDIFVTNGHVDDNIAQLDPNASYGELPKVWRNLAGRFRYLGPGVAPYFETTHVGRGAAFGDIDNDGWTDIAVNHVDSPPAVLRNVSPAPASSPTPWIRITLVGRGSNRDAIGARVELAVPNLPGKLLRQRTGGASYLSDHDGRLLVGLGDISLVTELTVRWPSGLHTTLHDVAPGQEITVREDLSSHSR